MFCLFQCRIIWHKVLHYVTYSNLATEEEYRNRKPDMIYVYGYEDGKKHQYFYQDDENDMMVALLISKR